MAQFIKFSGVIKNPSGRPVLTAGSAPAFLILDARRYINQFENGVTYDEIKAIGTLSDPELILKKPDSINSESGFLFSIEDGVPSLNFNDKQSISAYFKVRNRPVTVVCVYRVSSESWQSNSTLGRIYSFGRTHQSALKFLPISNNLLVWSTAEANTGYRYDQPHSGWAVSVHKFDGKNSRLINRLGELVNLELSETDGGPSAASLFGSATKSEETQGGIRYFAAYDSDMPDSDLLNLFYDAKNSFNIP